MGSKEIRQQGENGCRYLLEHFSKMGDLVLEPFAGSGTFLEVCKEMKRKCVGIEIDKEMVEVIKGRLSEEKIDENDEKVDDNEERVDSVTDNYGTMSLAEQRVYDYQNKNGVYREKKEAKK